MSPAHLGLKPVLLGALLAVAALGLAAHEAKAITFGEPDCDDNATNSNCRHPNTVSVSGFRASGPNEPPVDGVSSVRCSGSLLSKNADRFVILTAGHCASAYIAGLQSGGLIDVGVSFDALIERDVPQISAFSWTPKQYVLGGIPVLPQEYGPQGANAWNLHFDYAVIVFEIPAGGVVTHGGTPVDLSAIDLVTLPAEGLLEDIVDASDTPIVTAVGYGVGEAHKKPREGGRKGAGNDLSVFGVRYLADGTGLTSFLGPNQNLVFGSQNPARGFIGTCGGDSGGPIFYQTLAGEIQVGVTSSGDAICRGSAIIARTDAPEAQDFLHCVLEAGDTASIEACGCTAVGPQGECAQ